MKARRRSRVPSPWRWRTCSTPLAETCSSPSGLGWASLSSQPAWAQAWMRQREGDDLLLHLARELVRHPGQPVFSGPQDLQTMAEDLAPPAVVAGAVDSELLAASGDADPADVGEQSYPSQVETVILSHDGPPFVA